MTDKLELWGGIECTINRVDDQYMDQLSMSGHYNRSQDIDLLVSTGIKRCRYPVLWERHQPEQARSIDWNWAAESLDKLKQHGIKVIAGLTHHGSGPKWVNFYDGSFEGGLAAYAKQVATRFPDIEYYTPVNEPVTTARFCGLYGLWYPHGYTDYDFVTILLSECKATVLAMQEIRKINPAAKLVQTEDLSRTYSTPLLQYQADFENHRRWLGFDLLCGKVLPGHPLWEYLLHIGIEEKDLYFFAEHVCKPDILGFNYYPTSERYLDEDLEQYPMHTHGSNGKQDYADVELVRVSHNFDDGAHNLLKEAWGRYNIPIAITEVHLHCTREEQMRWCYHIWQTAKRLRGEGADICAVTAWAMLGSFGWDKLLTARNGSYESGVFDVSGGTPKPTALLPLIQSLAQRGEHVHPVLEGAGWWHRAERIVYRKEGAAFHQPMQENTATSPILILGKTGTLGQAFARVCKERNLHHLLIGRQELDITDEAAASYLLKTIRPWAVINATGYVQVDEAEENETLCRLINAQAPAMLSKLCFEQQIKFVTFSSDLVFDGQNAEGYVESDIPAPLNAYGRAKHEGEKLIEAQNTDALIIRTSAFFSPWDKHNFVHAVLQSLQAGEVFKAANDMIISPTYVPDLVHHTLDHLLDSTRGVLHIASSGKTTWAELAMQVAVKAGYSVSLIEPVSNNTMQLPAKRPHFSTLVSERGARLPYYEDALDRYFELSDSVHSAEIGITIS